MRKKKYLKKRYTLHRIGDYIAMNGILTHKAISYKALKRAFKRFIYLYYCIVGGDCPSFRNSSYKKMLKTFYKTKIDYICRYEKDKIPF